MRKNFFSAVFSVLGAAASIVGSVIGAGFITGKEIAVFIVGDFSLIGVIVFFLFFFIYVFALSICSSEMADKIIRPFIGCASVIIASSMIAALDLLYKSFFQFSEYFRLFTITTVILAIIISLCGVETIGVSSLFVMPFVIAFVLILSVVYRAESVVSLIPKGVGGIVYPVLYAGINCLLSSRIIVDSTVKLSVKQKIFVSFFSAFFLFLCVLSIAFCINGKSGEMPFTDAVSKNIICIIIVDIITIFSIFTTLVSAVYSAFSTIKGKTSALWKIVVTLVVVMLSGFGFEKLVERLYPPIGIIGTAYFIVLVVLISISRKKRRANTSRLQECRELRSKPLRGRV